MKEENKMEKIVSLAKRRGFIYQGSEIYGGLAGTWDYGPLGVALKNNIKDLWWKMFVEERDDMYGLDSAILMNTKVWEASGHLSHFTDPLIECKKCNKKFRVEHPDKNKCPDCGTELSKERKFNLMFETHFGAAEDKSSVAYLRPEAAQGMFTNFKNIIDSFHPKLPFGIAQIGKSFRNEINARDFLFRAREFELMEFEYFVRENEWEKYFDYWKEQMWQWIKMLGIQKSHVNEVEVGEFERAHYSKHTIDFEYEFPFGTKELYGLAYRTDFDLKNHKLFYTDEKAGETLIPHVIEPTFGLDRTVLAILIENYTEDELGGEKRIFLKLPSNLAPVKVAVFPLLRNKPELVEHARQIFEMIKKEIPQTIWDDNGNIGKRYRRQDEIGTPNCITIDFETLENDTVTIRDRDSGEQRRVKISDIMSSLAV